MNTNQVPPSGYTPQISMPVERARSGFPECHWLKVRAGFYLTTCGLRFAFAVQKPTIEENAFHYCPKCGRPIQPTSESAFWETVRLSHG